MLHDGGGHERVLLVSALPTLFGYGRRTWCGRDLWEGSGLLGSLCDAGGSTKLVFTMNHDPVRFGRGLGMQKDRLNGRRAQILLARAKARSRGGRVATTAG